MGAMSSSTSLRSLQRQSLSPQSLSRPWMTPASTGSARRAVVGFRISRLQENQPREQVAAVCYRLRDSRLEFLLVRTRRGSRWIFPKGGVEPGLTRSQSAALEALEEAGVRGSIEEAPFAEYATHDGKARAKVSRDQPAIGAYLCAVAWVSASCEAKRNPTWFSAEKAKKRLAKNRDRRSAQELCRVVDRAVMRTERLQRCAFAPNDALRRNEFEAPQSNPHHPWQTIPRGSRSAEDYPRITGSVVLEVNPMPAVRKILQLGPSTGSQARSQFVPRTARQPRDPVRRKIKD
jgi:8-oxo-dGTP pyrophosphatase MutT (NUDIX family)